MLTWEFECNKCKSKFKRPVPRGPTEERKIECPKCKSKDLNNLSLCSLEAPHCGG